MEGVIYAGNKQGTSKLKKNVSITPWGLSRSTRALWLDPKGVLHLSRMFSIGLEQTGSIPLAIFLGHTQAIPLNWSPEEKQSSTQQVKELGREAEPFLPRVAIPGFLFIHSTNVYSVPVMSHRGDGFWDPEVERQGATLLEMMNYLGGPLKSSSLVWGLFVSATGPSWGCRWLGLASCSVSLSSLIPLHLNFHVCKMGMKIALSLSWGQSVLYRKC